MKTTLKLFLACFFLISCFSYCSSDDKNSSEIPSDSQADPNPIIDEVNTSIPNAQFSTEGEYSVVRIDLTGIQHPETKEWLKLFGTKEAQQNVWVEVDGVAKGVVVYNNDANSNNNKTVYADLVFLVDNSGSMGQEADSVANGIVKWATNLSKQKIDIKFGCVGYESGVNGALNFTNVEGISQYLNRAKGTSRTKGFEGEDKDALIAARSRYQHGSDECGSEALRFADENFSFRNGANRVYVNFTDEPNQPGGYPEWSVEYVADQSTWNAQKGTIHTVYSADTTFSASQYYREKPWMMSRYTGGTELFVPSSFKDVTLDVLPVTGAMVNSYIIKFKNTSTITDGLHQVKITILSPDKKVKAEKVFKNIRFGTAAE